MVMSYDASTICGEGSNSCEKVTHDEAKDYFQIGPPYIMHRHDFLKVIPKYWELMPTLFKHSKDKMDILIDMCVLPLAATSFEFERSVSFCFSRPAFRAGMRITTPTRTMTFGIRSIGP